MTVTIDLPPDVVKRVKQAADLEGVDVPTFVREATLSRLLPSGPPQLLSDADLLECINNGFPETFWDCFRALVALSHTGTLTPEEHKELIAHTEQTENRDAERLMYLIELSKRRSVSVQSLMAELGLHPVSFD